MLQALKIDNTLLKSHQKPMSNQMSPNSHQHGLGGNNSEEPVRWSRCVIFYTNTFDARHRSYQCLALIHRPYLKHTPNVRQKHVPKVVLLTGNL